MNPGQNQFNVTSFNQQGGITAGQVNIGHPPRDLDANMCAELLKHLPKDKTVVVSSVMGDGEAFQFATRIKNFLTGKGFSVDGVNQAIYSQPVQGQHVNLLPDHTDIIIGNRQ